MDELYDIFRDYAVTTLAVFSGLALWSHVRRELNKRAQSAAVNLAAKRMDQGGQGVEFIPVEEWPEELDARDK